MAVMEQQTEDALRRLATSFGGVPMWQTWGALYLWELVLNDRDDLVAIVEIGTAQGGLSRYLSCQASMRGIDFVTFDVLVPDSPPYEFERLDVFAEAESLRMRLSTWDAPIILLCDGGNKPREAREFAPALPAGSLLVVHDWGTEFLRSDVPAGVEMVYEDACEALGSMSRVFLIPEREE